MLVNGLSPGLPVQDQRISLLDEEKLSQELERQQQEAAVKEMAKKEAIENEQRNTESHKEKKENTKFAMSEYNLKELLFLVSSRGNTATVEKLAELLKKEKEMLSGKK